jgi:choline-sulfatase
MTRLLALALSASFAAAQDQPPPVILISIDTLRADHLSAYGYRKIKTPNIDSFAATLFTGANSQIPLTLPSHTSLFTSTYPFENGIEENAEVVSPGTVTLATVLRSHGLKTAAFVGSNILARSRGLDQGFDDYDSPFGAPSSNPYSSRVRRDGALVLRAANAWLAAHRNQPVFVFVHLFDLHTPYKLKPSQSSNEPETAGYDAELEYIDQLMGRFRQSLIDNGWWKKSIVILLADHGESLGDHGELSHGFFIYESTLHVPLMIHWPDGAPQLPGRITEPAGLIDVAPTILDTLHLPPAPSFHGISLLHNGPHAIYSESVYARDSFGWAALRALRVANWKYIDAPRPELFDLTKDPHEQSNLIHTNPSQAAALRSELSRLIAKFPRSQTPARDTSDATRKSLGSLGYLSGGSRKPPSNDDPKDRLAEYQKFDRALDAVYSQRLDAAIALFREILTLHKDNLPARSTLGDAYMRAGKPADAVREWTSALAADPQYAPAAQALGEYYISIKDWPKARAYLQQIQPADPTVRQELELVDRNLRP